ncbi:MAG: class I SAM-dependent methyltransferase [Elusimicrobiota bacterium]
MDTTRFGFGKNWGSYSTTIDDKKIGEAVNSLKSMLKTDTLEGKTFIDIGSGSGLFSLAAKRLGAKKIHSFDYDPNSVETTAKIKSLYYPEDTGWTVEHGDILDTAYLSKLGTYNIVYSWGVLHHTGNMWQTLRNTKNLAATGDSTIFIALYNDQGWQSVVWKTIKRWYNTAPTKLLKTLILYLAFIRLWYPTFIKDLLKLQPGSTWKTYEKNRGMSPWHDVIDWVGGYPFEVARFDDVVSFFHRDGFTLINSIRCYGHGNSEFVFRTQLNK